MEELHLSLWLKYALKRCQQVSIQQRLNLYVVMGDCNIRLDCLDDSTSICFLDIMENFWLCQLVDQPTHNGGGSLDIVVFGPMRFPTRWQFQMFQWHLNVEAAPQVYKTLCCHAWRNFEINNFRPAAVESDLVDNSYIIRQTDVKPWQHTTMLFSRSDRTALHQRLASHVAQRGQALCLMKNVTVLGKALESSNEDIISQSLPTIVELW